MKKIYTLLFLLFALSIANTNAQTASWSALTSGTTNNLVGVYAINSSICYAAGSTGTILKTTNGGTSWVSQASGTSENFYSIFFTDANTGYAVGDNNTAVKTTNGGTNWTAMTFPIVSGNNFRYVYFIDANTGFMVGGNSATAPGTLLKTTNAGTSWTSISTSSVSTSNLYSIFFISPTVGYTTEISGKILKTTNTGSSWTALTSGTTTNLQNVFFTDTNNGIVIGDNGVIRTTSNGGTNWSAVTSGTTTDYLTGIDFYNASNGVVVGGSLSANTGVILTTTNGGGSWSVYHPGTSRLLRVDFVNANLGFAVGLNGTILKYASNVGINEKPAALLTFSNYPNPFSSVSTIDFGDYHFENTGTVELYNISGKLVKSILSEKQSKVTVERSNLSAGTYLYKVLDGSKYIGSGKMTIK